MTELRFFVEGMIQNLLKSTQERINQMSPSGHCMQLLQSQFDDRQTESVQTVSQEQDQKATRCAKPC